MENWLLGYWGIGVLVGFLNGLLGTGGGATMVLMLVWLFEAQQFPREYILHLALGTSMSSIIFTSMASVRAHATRGAVRWEIVKLLTPGMIIGGLAGALLASSIPPLVLALLFVAVVYVAAANLLIQRQPNAARALPGRFGGFIAGATISGVSAFTAIGGAFLSVPFMLWCNVPMLHAIGTATAIGIPIALAGTVGYVTAGWFQADLPGWSFGYVYFPALLGIIVASIAAAPFGAVIAHRLPASLLRKFFAALLVVLATRFLITLVLM